MDIKLFTKFNDDKARYDISFLSEDVAKKIFQYHKSFPMYEKTPLWELNCLSQELGVLSVAAQLGVNGVRGGRHSFPFFSALYYYDCRVEERVIGKGQGA